MKLRKGPTLYQIPLTTGLAAATGVGALGSGVVPGAAQDPVLGSAHQVLAFTGFAFAAYLALALVLIVSGLVIRKMSTLSHEPE